MSEVSVSKCRYLAEFKIFKDFEEESNSNSEFIQTIVSSLCYFHNDLCEEIEKRTQETDSMKNKLCREIRMEILNFAETLSQSVVGRIGEFFRKAGEEIEEIKLNMAKTIQNNNACFTRNQGFYQRYYSQLKENVSAIDTLSKQIRDTNKEQIVKTKYFEIQGKNIEIQELNTYDLKRNHIGIEIRNLEKINSRLRTDSSTQIERLSGSYKDLISQLNQQRKEYQDRLITIFSKLIADAEPCLGVMKQESVFMENQQLIRSGNIIDSKNPVSSMAVEKVEEENLNLPTFPGRSSLYQPSELDSLFLSKSVQNNE